MRYELEGNNNPAMMFEQCESKFCTTIFEGKLSSCYFPLIADTFNAAYEEKFIIDDSDIVDLYEKNLTKEKLFDYLRKPLSMCRYCGNMQYVDWESCNGRETCMNDWVKS